MNDIRRCQNRDLPTLFKLFKIIYPSNPRLQELDFFDWQYKSNPFKKNDEYSFIIHSSRGDIKGFIGYVPVQFHYKKGIEEGVWIQNWHSESGGFTGLKLLRKIMGEYDYRFMIGTTQKSNSIYETLNIPILKAIPRWIAIIEPAICIDLFKISYKADQKVMTRMQDLSIEQENIEGMFHSTGFLPEEEFFINQWKQVSSYIRRTGKYLNWRYFDIPRHTYRCIRYDQEQFLIYRIEPIMHHQETVIRILEWNITARTAKKALAYLIREGKKAGSILIDFHCTANEVGKELTQCGFFSDQVLSTSIPSLFRPIYYKDQGISAAIDFPPHRRSKSFDFNEWYITKGDGDIDRVKL